MKLVGMLATALFVGFVCTLGIAVGCWIIVSHGSEIWAWMNNAPWLWFWVFAVVSLSYFVCVLATWALQGTR